MKLKFIGAAGEVTGSCYLIEANGHKILIECGLFQGGRESEKRNSHPFPFKPKDITALILSHAHLDHSGRIPKLVKEGFNGTVYAQRATVDLCQIMLKDSAHINEKDAEWERRKGHKQASPLYTMHDAEKALRQFKGVDYDQSYEIVPGIRFCLRDAGHILGSSIVELWLQEDHKTSKIVFSGDLGHTGAPILCDPNVVTEADLVLLESTYGDRNHRSWEETWVELGEVLKDANKHQGNILIPAFAVGRTQELLYVFKKHFDEWNLADWRIFLDSPMALETTEVYQKHQHLYDVEAQGDSGHLFGLPNLSICRSPDESIALNRVRSGAIIIAGSGMCTGGRIRHHLKHNIHRQGSHIIVIGFQAKGTLGRELVEGAKQIRLLGEIFTVRAKVHTIGGLSAHADQQNLLAWYDNFQGKPPVALVHGEGTAITTLAQALRDRFHPSVSTPVYGETISW